MLNRQELERLGRRVLIKYLAEAGLQPRSVSNRSKPAEHHPDQLIELRLPDGKKGYAVAEFKPNSRSAPLESGVAQLRQHIKNLNRPRAFPLIFSWHLGKPMRDWLRSEGVWFADLSGNHYFKAPGLLVDREVAERSAAIPKSSPSPFADRSSLILRYLLPRPSERLGIRELARKLELSQAAVSVGLRRLADMGYLESPGGVLSLRDRESLLEEWVSFYQPRFRQQRHSRYYVHARSAEAIISLLRSKAPPESRYALSLHAGASLVAPFVQFREVHLYYRSGSEGAQSKLLKSLGAEPASNEANLIIVEPFYKGSVFFDSRVRRHLRVVSDLQLYLDLQCFPQRGREQADVILQRRLKPGWSDK